MYLHIECVLHSCIYFTHINIDNVFSKALFIDLIFSWFELCEKSLSDNCRKGAIFQKISFTYCFFLWLCLLFTFSQIKIIKKVIEIRIKMIGNEVIVFDLVKILYLKYIKLLLKVFMLLLIFQGYHFKLNIKVALICLLY